jgi:hypothetical protein
LFQCQIVSVIDYNVQILKQFRFVYTFYTIFNSVIHFLAFYPKNESFDIEKNNELYKNDFKFEPNFITALELIK